MANIRKLGQSWQARVRRRGFPDETKSFPTKAEAERWARSIEGESEPIKSLRSGRQFTANGLVTRAKKLLLTVRSYRTT